jgi:hypothetical protein
MDGIAASPDAAIAVELPDGKFAVLWDFGSAQYLLHTMTGETIKVFGDDSKLIGGPWTLQLNDDSALLVGPGSDEESVEILMGVRLAQLLTFVFLNGLTCIATWDDGASVYLSA